MDKINEIKQKLEAFQAKSAAREEIQALIKLVVGVLKKSKDEFDTLSAENKSVIKQGIAYIEDFQAKQAELLDGKTNTAMGEFDAKIALLKAMVDKALSQKPKDGVDGKDGSNGADGTDGKDGSPDDGNQIADKLNTLEEVIEQKVIKGLVKKIADISSNIAHGAVKEGAKLYTGTSETRVLELIAKNPSASTGGGIALTDLSAGTGISYDNTTGVITNSAPDQTVALTPGTNITSITGTYPNFTINAATQAGGAGDMVLASAQTNTGVKTFATGTLISPDITGGTAVGSNIIYKSTTGAGTAAGIAHQFVGGTDGATVAATILNNGNVGIGTTAPTAGKLVINYPTSVAGQKYLVGSNNGNQVFSIQDDIVGDYGGALVLSDGLGTAGYIKLRYNGGYPEMTTSRTLFSFSGSGFSTRYTNSYIDFGFGGVYKMTLSGEAMYLGQAAGLAVPVARKIVGEPAVGTDKASVNIALAGGQATGNAAGGGILFQTSDVGISGTTLQTLSTKMAILNSGNVGIGTTTPTAVLHLKAGTATASTAPLKLTSGTLNTTAEAGALLFNAPSGTPVGGQKLMIRIKDNATARALTYNAIFRAIGVTLPTTTVISKTHYIGCVYNATDTKWDVLAVGQEA